VVRPVLQPLRTTHHPRDAVAGGDQVTDPAGAAGPAYRVRPLVVLGWDADMRAPTRWSFADATTTPTP
jgi:hypothetical protein